MRHEDDGQCASFRESVAPVELPLFEKSTFSASCNCVEVGISSNSIYVRDSKSEGFEDRAMLQFTPSEWSAFLLGVKAGQFDLP